MSYATVDASVKLGGLRGAPKAVLMALASFADRETRQCYPSHESIAERSGVSERTVLRAIKALATAGYIIITRRRRQSSVFTVMVESSQFDGKRLNRQTAPFNRQNRPQTAETPDLFDQSLNRHLAVQGITQAVHDALEAIKEGAAAIVAGAIAAMKMAAEGIAAELRGILKPPNASGLTANLSPYPVNDPVKEVESPPQSPEFELVSPEPEKPKRKAASTTAVGQALPSEEECNRVFLEQFWPAYPLKVDRGQAMRNFHQAATGKLHWNGERKSATHKPVPFADMVMGAIRYAEYCESSRVEPKYRKRAHNWLSARGWENTGEQSTAPIGEESWGTQFKNRLAKQGKFLTGFNGE